jgi:hypothetical protein
VPHGLPMRALTTTRATAARTSSARASVACARSAALCQAGGACVAQWDRVRRVTPPRLPATTRNRSMEHESMVGKFRRRQYPSIHHELEWFNRMTYRGGDTSIGGRRRPYSEASRDQGGGGNCKRTDLAHLRSPRLLELRLAVLRPDLAWQWEPSPWGEP